MQSSTSWVVRNRITLKYLIMLGLCLVDSLSFFVKDFPYISPNFLFFVLPFRELFHYRLGLDINLVFIAYLLLNIGFIYVMFIVVETKYSRIGWAAILVYLLAVLPFISIHSVII